MDSRAGELPSSGGISPESPLLPKSREERSLSIARLDGIVPLSVLKLRLRYRSPERRPSSAGIWPESWLLGKWILTREVRLEMQGGISPARPSASISKATTRDRRLVHVTPCQVQKSWEVLFHVARAWVGLWRRDLRQSRASLFVLVLAADEGFKADDKRMMANITTIPRVLGICTVSETMLNFRLCFDSTS